MTIRLVNYNKEIAAFPFIVPEWTNKMEESKEAYEEAVMQVAQETGFNGAGFDDGKAHISTWYKFRNPNIVWNLQ